MESSAASLDRSAPSHVPASLVVDFQFELMDGASRDAVQAAANAVRSAPPIFYAPNVERGQGAWVIARHDLIREVYQDAGLFSSKHNADFSLLIGESWDLLPLEKDPPEHGVWRTLMNPLFSPSRMKAVEETIKSTSSRLVDAILAKGEAEFVKDFSEIFPVNIFLGMFGLPLEHTSRFVGWANDLLHSPTMEGREQAAKSICDYLRTVITERRAQPTGDVISFVVTAEVEGRGVTDQEALAMCFLLYSAGLDTVASMLAYMFKHLAEHPDDQQALRDDPALIPNAIEELLRAYPIVVSHRLVTRDVEFHGVRMKAGDRINLPTMLAGRDEQEFSDADKVDFAREKVNHITFAAGPHRCLGSHLARRELRVALEEWLTRVPPFRIKAGEQPVTHGVGVFGVNYLPLTWDAA
jgi:cytochrome P450